MHVLLAALLLLAVFISPAQAQVEDSALITLKASYRGQLLEYQTAESQFLLAKGQYTQLNTLASLEDLLQASQQLMFKRSQILLTYFKLLETNLVLSQGIELSVKESLLSEIRSTQDQLATQDALEKNAPNKTAVEEATAEFVARVPAWQNLAAYARAVLKLGRQQAVYDQAQLLLNKTNPQEDNRLTALELSQKQRAYDEIMSKSLLAKTELVVMWEALAAAKAESEDFDLNQALAKNYATISQLINYLDEFTK